MKTIKIATPTTTNYVISIDGLFFAVRKNNKGFWKSVSYKANLLPTDDYLCTVLDGHSTKKEAIVALINRIKEVPKYFFHNI